jgi:protease-4
MKRICLVLLGVFIFIVAVSAIAALVSSGGHTVSPLADKVALIYVRGPIVDSHSAIEELKKYGDDNSIKAVVLRVDSPGGGVAPSQEIFQEVKRVADEKPLVVSMGSVAASGGYYISAPASRIMANPGTLTGSIGVIMEIPNIEGLLDKVGVKTEVIKSGENKDIASAFRQMSPKEREILQGVIDDVFQQFVDDVAQSRGMSVEDVRKLADGRVYTGRQALELGLVDELGGLEDAIDLSAEMAGIEGEPSVVTTKEKKGLFELLDGKFSASMPKLFPSLQVKYLLTP